MSEKEITLDLETQTYVEEKMKRTRKVPCSEKMLENLAKGREKRKQLYMLEEKKKQKELDNLCKEKEQIKKERDEFDKLRNANYDVKEVKKPRKKYTRKPKQEQIIQDSDTSSSEDYVVEKQKPTKIVKKKDSCCRIG